MQRAKIVVESANSLFRVLQIIEIGGGIGEVKEVTSVKKACASEKLSMLRKRHYIFSKPKSGDRRGREFLVDYPGLFRGFFRFLKTQFEQYVVKLKSWISLKQSLGKGVGTEKRRLSLAGKILPNLKSYESTLEKSEAFQSLFRQIIGGATLEPTNRSINDCFEEAIVALTRLEAFVLKLEARYEPASGRKAEWRAFHDLVVGLSDFRRELAFPINSDVKSRVKKLLEN